MIVKKKRCSKMFIWLWAFFGAISLSRAEVATNSGSMEKDSRFISYQDLLSTSKRFYEPQTAWYSTLLFDVARNQVVVGARDQVYRMSFDLEVLERAAWEAPSAQVDMCLAKGQSEALCRNYVRLLVSDGEQHLYACGTYAFNPSCTWRQMENLTVLATDSGIGKCPFNPLANITGLMTQRRRLFAGTTTDFSGSDAGILRTDVQPQQQASGAAVHGKVIRTKQYNNKWLNDPQFIGSFEAEHYVYFVFREPAMEYMNCGKAIYSRIARVCKNDMGGDQMLRDSWTSFLKARLNCSLPGEYPFYFDELQGMTYSVEQSVLYATFSTPPNSISGSAVCAYNLSAINAAFDGAFKFQDGNDAAWRPVRAPHNTQFQCEASAAGSSSRYKELLESARYQLMDQAIQPMTQQPLYVSEMERFEHIALDTIYTKTEQIHVLYVATAENLIKKLAVKRLPAAQPIAMSWRPQHSTRGGAAAAPVMQTCLVEILQFGEPRAERILTLEYLKVTESLYVGTDLAVTRIPAQRCSRHVSQTSCVNAMDPYCGWNELTEHCTPLEMAAHMSKFWTQAEALQCPILTAPIDGAWSAWSDWFKCHKLGQAAGSGGPASATAPTPAADDDEGDCLCRTRDCNNPRPRNGGHQCAGITTQVQNCTVHGGWTEWSAWSACSQTCGIAVKTRRRTCGNPRPAHGGRTCLGPEHAEVYCHHLPPCPAPKPVAVDGSWGPWGEWSECSNQCGGGFRLRRRDCNDPSPLNGGLDCAGCSLDYEVCNTHACTEERKLSTWTPWLMQPPNATTGDGGGGDGDERQHGEERNGTHLERRYRFLCRAHTPDVNSLRVSLVREETRICRADGSCQRHSHETASHPVGAAAPSSSSPPPAAADDWEWGACSVACGGGLQFARTHRGHHHGGQQSRVCNTHPCPTQQQPGGRSVNEVVLVHDWGCWTEWSQCSVSCGVGLRRRTRKCLGGQDKLCEGRPVQEEKCEMAPCEDYLGWGEWSEWSECSREGLRFRHRKCLAEEDERGVNDCQGSEYEKTVCVPSNCEGTPSVSAASIGLITTFVVLGYVASICFTYYATRRRYAPIRLVVGLKNTTTTPAYDSYPNQYSSLPTKDIYDVRPKVKRQSSFNMCSPSKYCNGGTLNRNNINHNHTPKVLSKTYNDCETSTLKRHANTLNNHRTNIDDEKF